MDQKFPHYIAFSGTSTDAIVISGASRSVLLISLVQICCDLSTAVTSPPDHFPIYRYHVLPNLSLSLFRFLFLSFSFSSLRTHTHTQAHSEEHPPISNNPT